MSAFIVSTHHINTIVSTLINKDSKFRAVANDIANVLMGENYKSVNFRYNENDKAEKDFFQEVKPVNALQFLKLCECLDYQSCETNEYRESLACHTLKSAIEEIVGELAKEISIEKLKKTTAYDNCEWTINENTHEQNMETEEINSKERNTEIANEIVRQIGGIRRLKTMIGAYNYFVINNGLQFQFKAGTKTNKIQIILNAMDTYDVTLYKTRGINCKEVASVSGIYCDQLKSWIERNTGLYLSL